MFESPTQKKMYERFPTIYIWDDHDFGDNDSGRSSPVKKSAFDAY